MERLALLLLTLAAAAGAVPSIVEPVSPGVLVVRDDNGSWGGSRTGITHQNRAVYKAKKILDLSDLSDEQWAQVREARLSAYLVVHDYSWHDLPEVNGLDEALQFVVNGHEHTVPTNAGLPVYPRNQLMVLDWYDLAIPKAELQRGVNEIVVQKAPGEKTDDYLYLGIDNSADRGNSMVAFNEDDWTQEKLTIPGGDGEYMVRLYLITEPREVRVEWRPGAAEPLVDPAGVVDYAGTRDALFDATGLRLAAGQPARMEWGASSFDSLEPLKVTLTTTGPVQAAWLDADGKPGEAATGDGTLELALPAGRTLYPSGLVITSQGDATSLTSAVVEGSRGYHPVEEPVNVAPAIAPAPPPAPPQAPSVNVTEDAAVVLTPTAEARFEFGERLRLASLRNPFTGGEMLRSPDDALLFLVEAGEQRYGGTRDFRLEGVRPIDKGFLANLVQPDAGLQAVLMVLADDEGLRLGLDLGNNGGAPVDFKLAFPHLAGLSVSDDPADDYYYFPFGGGIISPRAALIRKGYGDHEALYQVIDVYSPAKGAGLYVRADDAEGWHKVMALRKSVPGESEAQEVATSRRVRDEYEWDNSLAETVEGTSVAYEYLRRTRPPGESFAPAAAVIAGHPGDWHVAMQAYSDWAHRVWQWRPFPSALKPVHNMIAAGWGTSVLFRDGAYRTDIIKPRTDCAELMSWWDWSETGPWNTPFDRLDEVMTAAEQERWKPYFVTDPVTGEKMWNNQPGDYRGYNERFGGLPAFREAIDTYRDLGADIVTLYTDPFRLDESSETGRLHGREWGVVGEDGEKTRGYHVWNPCHDLEVVREWVAVEMGRVMRETGADGIRLDEYGHRGWACYDETHDHTYAEPGITQWMKATTDATRRVHEAMDAVRPDLVLTTEHPGYDYLMTYLEGCITYDLTVVSSPLRPMECNIQRFYFPECKAYELDHRGADPTDRKKFWNAVESFGRYYPLRLYNILADNENVYHSRDAYPLLVTPGGAPFVYVNRFRGDGKSLYHLYNASGHTHDGPALTVDLQPGEHVVELLSGRELTPSPRADGQGADVAVYLERDDVACVAVLSQRLTVERDGATLTINADLPAGEHTLQVTKADGGRLAEQSIAAGTTTVTLTEEGEPVLVKVLRDGEMLDAAGVG